MKGGCKGKRELFIQLAVGNDNVMGIPCNDDETSGDEIEVL